MKKLLFISAIALAASTSAMAETYSTVQGGYQWAPSNTKTHQVQANGYSQDEHGLVSIAVGQTISDYAVQVEYSNVKASGNVAAINTKQENINLVGIVPITSSNSTSIYSVVGAGYTRLTTDNTVQTEEGANGIIGLGLTHELNKTVALVTEVRGQYNLEHNYWQPQATAGLRFNLNSVVNNILGR